MDKNTINAIEVMVNSYGKPVTVAGITNDLNTDELRKAALGTASLVESMASTFGKKLPGVGVGLSLSSLSLNLRDIGDGAINGEVQQSDILGAAADLTGLLGTSSFLLAPLAVTGAPVLVLTGAALIIASATLTLVSLSVNGNTIETPDLMGRYPLIDN